MFRRAIFAALLLTLTAWGQDVHIEPRVKPAPQTVELPDADETIHKKVNLALVPVSVVTDEGVPFQGLQVGHFRLQENGKDVPIRYFAVGDEPISVGFIFDRSGSMADKLQASKDAIETFVRNANPQDEFFMLTFADTIESVTDWTNGEDFMTRLTFTVGKGQTALLDSVVVGLEKMKTARYHRRALIIISDGGDNHSRYTEGYVKHLAEEADVTVFGLGLITIGIPGLHLPGQSVEFHPLPGSVEAEILRGPELMRSICESSGGKLFILPEMREVHIASAYIGQLLRTQYILGYTPQNMKDDGKFRKIKVHLQRLPKGVKHLHIDNVPEGIYARVGE